MSSAGSTTGAGATAAASAPGTAVASGASGAAGAGGVASADSDLPLTGRPWSSDGWEEFRKASQAMTERCGLLKLVVTEQWGGPSSSAKFESALEDWLSNAIALWDKKELLHRDTSSFYWEEVLATDFNCDLEGGNRSLDSLSFELASLFEQCSQGRYSKARQVQEDYIASVTRGGSKFDVEEVGGDSDGGGDGAGDAAPAAEEDDGWTTVPVRSKKGKGKGKTSSAPVAVAAPLAETPPTDLVVGAEPDAPGDSPADASADGDA